MKHLFSLLIFFFTPMAFALCSDSADQMEYRVCIAKKAEDSSQKVKSKQMELLEKIKNWDQEPQYKSETISLLRTAMSSFESFKKHQCNYEVSIAAGSNGGGTIGAQCWIRINQDYLESLESQLEWYESY